MKKFKEIYLQHTIKIMSENSYFQNDFKLLEMNYLFATFVYQLIYKLVETFTTIISLVVIKYYTLSAFITD